MGTVPLSKKSGDDLVTDAGREVISSDSECSSGTEKVSRIKDVGFQQMSHPEDSLGVVHSARHQLDAPIAGPFVCPPSAPPHLGVAERHQGPAYSLLHFLINCRMNHRKHRRPEMRSA